MRVLITGIAGFFGHHFLEHILRNTDWDVVGLDRLDVSGTMERIKDIECWEKERERVSFVWHDLKSPINEYVEQIIGQVDIIYHIAASSHVDRSIQDPMSFVMDNVVGTTNLLQFARTQHNIQKFFNFSTDEVFGPAPSEYLFKEDSPHNPSNPYAASKSGQEAMGKAFKITYGLPVITTRTMNLIGERQHPEKFVPMAIRKILRGEKIVIHSDPTKTKAASRFWIHCRNASDALLFLTEKGEPGEEYHIVGEEEVDVLTMAKTIAGILGMPLKYEMRNFHESRPGHDMRYALSGEKMKNMGWVEPKSFHDSLRKTVEWYLNGKNRHWIEA